MEAKQSIKELVEVYSTFYDGEEDFSMYDWVKERAQALKWDCDVDIGEDYIYIYCNNEEIYPNEVELSITFE